MSDSKFYEVRYPGITDMMWTHRDVRVAERYGITRATAHNIRRALGIMGPREKRSQKMMSLVGTDTDMAVSRASGADPRAVAGVRRDLGLQSPCVAGPMSDADYITKYPDIVRELASTTDAVLAKRHGVVPETVRQIRQAAGVPNPYDVTLDRAWELVASGVASSQVVKLTGVSATTVQKYRCMISNGATSRPVTGYKSHRHSSTNICAAKDNNHDD